MPEDYPTIDHLKSRFFGPREDPKFKAKTLVLACPACNNARCAQELKQHSFRTRWKSGSFPIPFRWVGRLLKWYRKQSLIAAPKKSYASN